MLKHRNITVSLSQELISELHLFVKKGGISHFVEEAITEKLKAQKMSLEEQYKEAASDKDRNRNFAEWDQLSDDGMNEQKNW